MSNNKQQNSDICSSIHSADKIDPFEGLNLDEICIPPVNLAAPQTKAKTQAEKGQELFALNPLDDINLKEMSVDPANMPKPSEPIRETEEISEKLKEDAQKDDVDFLLIETDNSEEEATRERQRYKRPRRSLSTDISHPPVVQPDAKVSPIIEKAYHYAEITQIRQKVFASLEAKDGNILLIASPHDNTGSSLLAAALAYNTASSCQQSVLLIDCNMRRAGLHEFFYIPQSYGFTDLVKDNIPWQAVVKETNIPNLSIITAGDHVENFSDHLRYAHIPNLAKDIQNEYDLIIFDTSPILRPNRNNVNIVSLTAVVDYFLLITKQSGTTKDHLKETQAIIEAGNGKIDGIVLNEHSPEKKPTPYKK